MTAAMEAVRQWRFEPTRLWGSPVAVLITVTFNIGRRDNQAICAILARK
jgi:outer membrane biosynthesis protein TonB